MFPLSVPRFSLMVGSCGNKSHKDPMGYWLLNMLFALLNSAQNRQHYLIQTLKVPS